MRRSPRNILAPTGVRSVGGRGHPPAQSPGLQVSGSGAWEGRGGQVAPGDGAVRPRRAVPTFHRTGCTMPLLTQVSWGTSYTTVFGEKEERTGQVCQGRWWCGGPLPEAAADACSTQPPRGGLVLPAVRGDSGQGSQVTRSSQVESSEPGCLARGLCFPPEPLRGASHAMQPTVCPSSTVLF